MYNNEFKSIDTEIKAYFLGQAFGDGSVSYEKKHYKFSMASIIEDEEIYKKLQQCFPFLKLKYYKSHSNMVYLECHIKDFVLDLKYLGLTQNKCRQDSINNFNFPNIREDLKPHFIRGFFDADGCVYTPSRHRSRNNIKVDIGLGTKNFCLQLQQELKNNNIKFKYIERYKKSGFDKCLYPSYTIQSSSRELSLKFANYIYNNASIYLERKYNKFFNSYIKSKKQLLKEQFPNCPNCNSNHIISNGNRNNKKRLLCKNCNKHFTVALPLI